jgi:predicted RNA-binding protein with PIN domain
MFYYIDGYNFIFTLTDTKSSLIHQRKSVIKFLQKQFSLFLLRGMLVFDGSHQRSEESGLSYASPLDIAYTPKGQTADEYILEKLEWHQQKAPVTVVSNDQGLARHARSLGAKTQSNETFLQYLEKKKAKKSAKSYEPKDTLKNIERLLKIFEEKLGQ